MSNAQHFKAAVGGFAALYGKAVELRSTDAEGDGCPHIHLAEVHRNFMVSDRIG